MRTSAVMTVILLLAGAASADDTLWTRTYSDSGAGMDQGRAVAAMGNAIFVTGTDMAATPNILLIRYTAAGDTVWTRVLDLDTMEMTADLALTSDTSPVVCVLLQAPTPSLFLVKCNKNGDTVWTRHRRGFVPTSLVLDNQGASYVWGGCFGTTPNESLGLVKYAADGTLSWDKSWDAGDMQRSGGMALDKDGNLIAVANVNDSSGAHIRVFKFNSSGDTLSIQTPEGLVGAEAQGVACDPTGAFYLTANRGAEFLVVRCSTSGRLDWFMPQALQGSPEGYNLITVDADTHVVVAAMDPSQRVTAIKLTTAGAPFWTGSVMYQAMIFGVAVDGQGHVIAAGMAQSTTPPSCLTVVFTGAPGVAEGRQGRGDTPRAGSIIGRAATVNLEARLAGDYSVVLYDARGAVVRQVYQGSLGVGPHAFSVPGLAAGTYYVRMTGPAGTSESKLVQVR